MAVRFAAFTIPGVRRPRSANDPLRNSISPPGTRRAREYLVADTRCRTTVYRVLSRRSITLPREPVEVSRPRFAEP